jgi:predicted RNA-binding protein YlqC (UPF0109 family)
VSDAPAASEGAEGDDLRGLVEFLARELVEDEEAVVVTEEEDERGVLLRLKVAPGDMGKVIGRGGRTARAIRQVVHAAAVRRGRRAHVEIVDA